MTDIAAAWRAVVQVTAGLDISFGSHTVILI
jgi:hypothetical protein